MKQSRIIKNCLPIIITLLSLNVFGDTIVSCEPDTLKLEYTYDGITYNDDCDVFYGDTIYLADNGNVVIQIEEPNSPSMLPLLVHKEDKLCLTNLGFQNYYSNITSSGEYTLFGVDTQAKNPPSLFYVIMGNSSSLEKSTIRANIHSGLEYQITVPDHFQNYEWSTGETDHFINTDSPGTYSVVAQNYCDETFEKSFILDESYFNSNPFYAGKDTGMNVNYVDYVPDVVMGGHPVHDSLYLDLDSNGVSDMKLVIDYFTAMGGGNAYFNAEPLNGCEILIKNNPLLIDTLIDGMIINDLCIFSSSPELYFFQESYTWPIGCSGGYWENVMNYLGFKLNSDEKTIYGWIRISLIKTWQFSLFTLDDYAMTTETNGIKPAIGNSQISFYPNPFAEKIDINTQLQSYSLMLLDVFGKTVFSKDNMSGNSDVNLQILPAGIYFLTIESEGIRQTKKVIKQF